MSLRRTQTNSPAAHPAPPDRQQWADDGLLHRTIERQLSRKPTFRPSAASGAVGHNLPLAGCLPTGSCMRIRDIPWHNLGGIGFITRDRERQKTTLSRKNHRRRGFCFSRYSGPCQLVRLYLRTAPTCRPLRHGLSAKLVNFRSSLERHS